MHPQGKGADAAGKTKTFTDSKGVTSCLITTDAFDEAGVALPDADGEVAVSNGGVAFGWGHGLGDGACGSLFLVQQGSAPGSQAHQNPGTYATPTRTRAAAHPSAAPLTSARPAAPRQGTPCS